MNLASLGVALGDRIGRHGKVVRALRPTYGKCLRLAYRGYGIRWCVNDQTIRIDPDVRHLVPRTQEREVFDFLRAHLQSGDVVFDVGSFLGIYAVMEARWVGESGRVLAFEPTPSIFKRLEHHLKLNRCSRPQVEAHCAALGARRERRVLLVDHTEPYRNMVAPNREDTAGVGVDVLTVDDISKEFGKAPDWIRMDVQGLEFDVLRGASDVLGEGRVRFVVEMHPQLWPAHGTDAYKAAELFKSLGLTAQTLRGGTVDLERDTHILLKPAR